MTVKSLVLQKWKQEFEKLYHIQYDTFDNSLKEDLLKLDQSMDMPTLDASLNCPLKLTEVEKVIDRLKRKKRLV